MPRRSPGQRPRTSRPSGGRSCEGSRARRSSWPTRTRPRRSGAGRCARPCGRCGCASARRAGGCAGSSVLRVLVSCVAGGCPLGIALAVAPRAMSGGLHPWTIPLPVRAAAARGPRVLQLRTPKASARARPGPSRQHRRLPGRVRLVAGLRLHCPPGHFLRRTGLVRRVQPRRPFRGRPDSNCVNLARRRIHFSLAHSIRGAPEQKRAIQSHYPASESTNCCARGKAGKKRSRRHPSPSPRRGR